MWKISAFHPAPREEAIQGFFDFGEGRRRFRGRLRAHFHEPSKSLGIAQLPEKLSESAQRLNRQLKVVDLRCARVGDWLQKSARVYMIDPTVTALDRAAVWFATPVARTARVSHTRFDPRDAPAPRPRGPVPHRNFERSGS